MSVQMLRVQCFLPWIAEYLSIYQYQQTVKFSDRCYFIRFFMLFQTSIPHTRYNCTTCHSCNSFQIFKQKRLHQLFTIFSYRNISSCYTFTNSYWYNFLNIARLEFSFCESSQKSSNFWYRNDGYNGAENLFI